MVKDNNNINIGKKGMSRDKHPSNLSETEYSIAINANYEDESGGGYPMLQNEHSNLLCSRFKSGFKVIGTKHDLNEDRTYFFITNPTTNVSEIGYISSIQNITSAEDLEVICGCNIKRILEDPLEGQVQTETCTFTTLVEDSCNLCLNFSVNHPIRDGNIQIKDEKCGKTLSWTDNFNPTRYIVLSDLDQYSYVGYKDCDDDNPTTCLDCDKLKIFRDAQKPCLKPTLIQYGGNLREGTYEFLMAYCDKNGVETSQYFSITPPVSIFDQNNVVKDQTQTANETNLGIKLKLTEIDSKYAYYKIAVIQQADVNNAVSYFEEGIHTTDDDTITYYSSDGKIRTTLNALLAPRVVYNTTEIMTSSNGYLFHAGLTAEKEMNLQPVVNLMGAFLRWQTHYAKEALYQDGIATSTRKTYMRDEVYPISIKFFMDNGFETSLFPFVNRPATSTELAVVSNEDVDSINHYANNCTDNTRTKRWQFYNTASHLGDCPITGDIFTEIVKQRKQKCFIENVDNLASHTVIVPLSVPYTTLRNYINTYKSEISDPGNVEFYDAVLAPFLTDDHIGTNCDPIADAGCVNPVLVVGSEEIFVQEVVNETSTLVPKATADYNFKSYGSPGIVYVAGADSGFLYDTAFMTNFMTEASAAPSVAEIVHTRFFDASNTNTTCVLSKLLSSSIPNVNRYVFSYHGGNVGVTDIQEIQIVSCTDVGVGNKQVYSNKLHKGAYWFKVEFGSVDEFHLEINPMVACSFTDDISTGTKLRASVFADCTDPVDTGCAIFNVADGLIMKLEKDAFKTALRVIDLTGTSGTATVTIDGFNYLATFNTDLTTTASDFVISHGNNILNDTGITITDNVGSLELSGSFINVSKVTTIANTTGDLDGVDNGVFSTNINEVWVAIDAPYEEVIRTKADTSTETVWRITPPCNDFTVNLREEYESLSVDSDDIIFLKEEEYTLDCTIKVPKVELCETVPFQYGKFAYTESTDKYPCNDELYNSQLLNIRPVDLPVDEKEEFEDYYVIGGSAAPSITGGFYDLNTSANMADSEIRHYLFPDNCIAPFMGEETLPEFNESFIFPIGVNIDNEVVNKFLDLAVLNGLITDAKRQTIVKYEIFRGDRTLDKGIIAKGLSYDLYKYTDEGEERHYSNYPYNDLGSDVYHYTDENRDTLIPHPFNGESNNRFTFHSPDIHFRKPIIPTEIKIEGFQLGHSRGTFPEVDDHSKWVLLGRDAYVLATTLAGLESLFEIALKQGELTIDYAKQFYIDATGLNNLGGIGLSTFFYLAGMAGIFGTGFFNIGRYRYEWLKILKDNGSVQNFVHYYTSEGFYNRFICNDDLLDEGGAPINYTAPHPSVGNPILKEGNSIRGLAASRYLKPGNYRITDKVEGTTIALNNYLRETGVYLSFGGDPTLDEFNFYYGHPYNSYDNVNNNFSNSSRHIASQSDQCDVTRKEEVRNIGSPYFSLKNYIPNQYGLVNSVKWLSTGYCGNLSNDNECDTAFGGDIFISRFSLKRKLPFFLANGVGLADRTPFDYYKLRNIGFPRFYCNHNVEEQSGLSDVIFPNIGSDFNLDCITGTSDIYVTPPAKMYDFSYGIPQFLVESEINCNYRHAKREQHERFYPEVGSYADWTQETNVSIKEDNQYYYNFGYSKNITTSAYRMLPSTYNKVDFDCRFDAPNGVIYSQQDNSEQDISDQWLVYKPLDFYQFPTSAGKLIDLRDIESSQILGRFENQVILFNAIDKLKLRISPESQELGTGGIFATRPLEFKKTELGYAGTQHKSMISCEYGHFWVDAKRGQVFQVDQNGRNLKEITNGLRNWFKEHLPFKIMKSKIVGLTTSDLDNSFKGLGISMGWDSRYKRVFLTKLDYVVVEEHEENITYEDGEFLLNGNTQIELTDTTYFTEASFTLAYNPLSQSWISYYSFKPNYYVNYHNYFQTGINYSADSTELGLWSHLLTNKSYQVFYGKLYPFMIELSNKENYVNKVLSTVEYWLDSRRYHNEYDFAENRYIGFNKAWLYNQSNNSGQLNLIREEKNNRFQKLQYPKQSGNTTDILATQNDKKWTFNSFYNRVTDENNNQPIWYYDNNQIDKTLNTNALSFNQVWLDRLRGDYNLVRLQQDTESRYKIIFKWLMNKDKLYN